LDLTTIDASQTYFKALDGITEPEQNARSLVSCSFDSLKEQAAKAGNPSF
jgi:GMP synthase PP-ATPase subunit